MFLWLFRMPLDYRKGFLRRCEGGKTEQGVNVSDHGCF